MSQPFSPVPAPAVTPDRPAGREVAGLPGGAGGGGRAIDENRRAARILGLLWGSALLWLGLMPLAMHGDPPVTPVAVGGGGLLLLGIVRPEWLRGPLRAWRWLGGWLGWINSRIILSLVFALIVTPLGWCLKWFGHDPLGLRHRRGEPMGRSPSRERSRDHFEHTF